MPDDEQIIILILIYIRPHGIRHQADRAEFLRGEGTLLIAQQIRGRSRGITAGYRASSHKQINVPILVYVGRSYATTVDA